MTTWKRIEVGLVLQGGGALGAYEWGAIEALFKTMDEVQARGIPISLKVVTGVSIGAINGACIVGAKGENEAERRQDGLGRLDALWNDLKLVTPFTARVDLKTFGLPSFAPARDMALFGLPGFYVPRMDFWNFWNWTNFYNTNMLEGTLNKYVCFEEINEGPTTFVVTAVDIKQGTLRRFRNKAKRKRAEKERPEERDDPVVFEPKHIIASGSLAPQFPWTDVDGRLYWDGGLVDNTPLGDAIQAFSGDEGVYRLLVVMNLYPLTAKKPGNLLDVADRVHELSFGNRLRQDRAAARRVNDLVRTIKGLAAAVEKAGLKLDDVLANSLAEVRDYKIAKTVEVDLQKSAGDQNPEDDESGLRDFSPDTVDKRRELGRQRAHAELIVALQEDGFLPRQRAA